MAVGLSRKWSLHTVETKLEKTGEKYLIKSHLICYLISEDLIIVENSLEILALLRRAADMGMSLSDKREAVRTKEFCLSFGVRIGFHFDFRENGFLPALGL